MSRHPRHGATMPRAPSSALGPIGRLGRLAAEHRRRVFIAWALIAVGLGILAPRVETALSGAGWQANGSESVQARQQIDRNFAGAGGYALQVVVHSRDLVATAPEFRQTVARSERVLRRDPAVRSGLSAAAGPLDLARRPHGRDPGRRGRRSERDGRRRRPPQDQACRRRRPWGCRQRDRRLGDVVGLQPGEPRSDAQVRVHLLAGDDGDPGARLRLAGGRGPAADADHRRADRLRRPALPRNAGLADLDLGDELRADVRARAGHRLRPVHRRSLPGRPLRPEAQPRRGGGDDDGYGRQGRALLGTDRAGLALGGDAGAEPRLPLDVPGHHRLGPLRAGRDADAAARSARQARPPGRPPVASLAAQRRASLCALRPLG